MGHKVTTTWKNKMLLESDNPLGKNLLMESGPDFGGSNQGLSPKALMLSSLGGCTGLDLLSLLKKMRVEIEGFKVIVNGELTEEHPKYYDLNKENIKKAVSLSEERYCGVIKMFRAFAEVTIAIHFNE
jgi:putative redox protein